MTDVSPAVYTVINYGIRSFDIHYDELRNRDVPTGIDQKAIKYVKLIHDGEQAEIVPALENDPDIIGGVPTEFKVVSDLPVQRVHNQNYAELREAVPPVIRIQDFIDDNPSNYRRYGLGTDADEIIFKDADSSFKLKIGDKAQDGSYYAVINDEKKVVTLNASTVDKLFAFSAFDLIDRFILLVSINVVDRINLVVDGNRYDIEIKREEAEGEEEPKERFFINRLEIEDKAFRKFYQELIGPVADTLNPDETALRNPDIRISYTLNKGKDKRPRVEYVKVDRDFYAPFVNGENTYLVSTAQVQDIKTALENVLKSLPQ